MDSGLRIEDIEVLAAPASGPKWLILYELDKYLMESFSAKAAKKRHFAGASAGAWRAACYCLSNDKAALEILYKNYIEQAYSEEPFGKEVSAGVRKVIKRFLGDTGVELINSPKNYLHISTSRAGFIIRENRSFLAKTKFLKPIFANAINRKYLGNYIERHIFSNFKEPIFAKDGLKTRFSKINKDNLIDALQASGSIPFAMNPVTMENAEYWDGGITDYHFGVDFEVGEGIAFLPHFRDHVSPGWFDKYPPFRKVSPENLVMVYPKKAFIDLLPNKKITDLEDFYSYAGRDEERFKTWYKAGELGKILVEDFDKLLNTSTLDSVIEKL